MSDFEGLTTVTQGTVGLGAAIHYFVANGYKVCIPLNDNQNYDLVVDRDGALLKVQVKTTKRKAASGNYMVELRAIRPNKTENIIRPFDNKDVDLLFMLQEDGKRYLIPSEKIEVKSALTLDDRWNEFLVE